MYVCIYLFSSLAKKRTKQKQKPLFWRGEKRQKLNGWIRELNDEYGCQITMTRELSAIFQFIMYGTTGIRLLKQTMGQQGRTTEPEK